MIDFTALTTIIVVHFLAVFSPGPDFFMTVRNALTYNRRVGVFTAVGLAMGICVHILYSVAGVALVISQSILLFNVIKYIGAAYLMYIGVKSILAKKSSVPEIDVEGSQKQLSDLQAIKVGFLTNVLNPKATLFFLSLFTIVISPDISKSTLAIGSFFMVLDTCLWFSIVSFFFTQKHIRSAYMKYETTFNKALGGLLLMLGLNVATSK